MRRFTNNFKLTGSLFTALLFALSLGWNALHCARFGAGNLLAQVQTEALVSLADCHTASPDEPQNQEQDQEQPSQSCPYCQASHGLAVQALPVLALLQASAAQPFFVEERQTAETRSSQTPSRAPPAFA